MSHPNFCPACGASAPLPATWREVRSARAAAILIYKRIRGTNCPECGVRLNVPPWKSLGGGLLLGALVTLAGTGWRVSTAPAPPPPFLPSPVTAGDPPAPNRPTAIARETHPCGARTKKGTPCRRLVPGKTGYCWQHRKG